MEISDIVVKTDTEFFTFKCDFLNKTSIIKLNGDDNIDRIVLTIIDTDTNIYDYGFNVLNIKYEDKKIIFECHKMKIHNGLFGFITFMVDDGTNDLSLLDIFNEYDGTVLTYNTQNFIKTVRSQHNGKVNEKSFILT